MGAPSDRYMTTGLHTVRDLSCIECGEVLGWHYVSVQWPDSLSREPLSYL